MDSRSWPCTPCGEIREFVQPACVDGHSDGEDCPEWACTGCGSAVVIGDAARPTSGRARVAA